MLHSCSFGLWSTLDLTTVTDYWLPVISTWTRSYSPSSVPLSDSFCSSHIPCFWHYVTTVALARESRCQISSDSNCVRLYTDASMDSFLTCPISACPYSLLSTGVWQMWCMRCGRLRWFWHLECKSVNGWVSEVRGLGRNRKRWRNVWRMTWKCLVCRLNGQYSGICGGTSYGLALAQYEGNEHLKKWWWWSIDKWIIKHQE